MNIGNAIWDLAVSVGTPRTSIHMPDKLIGPDKIPLLGAVTGVNAAGSSIVALESLPLPKVGGCCLAAVGYDREHVVRDRFRSETIV
jgi:hypothetical protein